MPVDAGGPVVSPSSGNLFDILAPGASGESIEALFASAGVRLERIVSHGQATPPGEWLAQPWTEWVVLLTGSAGLRFEGEATIRTLRPGDWVCIAANDRHRVEWTDAAGPSVWLAAHMGVGI